MKVVIPMAGYGSRMRPHTYSRPKPLVSVAGQPMLKYLVDSLIEVGIDEFIFIVGYLGDQLEKWITANYDVTSHFVVQEELSGQSPAIYLAREHLSGPTVVLFADTLFETDLNVINNTQADGIAFVKEVDDPRRFGVVETNEEGYITRFIEKPESMDNKNVVIGMYYIRDAAQMLHAIEQQMSAGRMTKGEYFLTDAFQFMIEGGAKFTTQPVTVWLDTGKPETVLETNRYLLDHGRDNSGENPRQGVAVIPPVSIHPSAQIASSVIGPYVSVAANCQITDSVISDSILESGAVVENALLEQSLIGVDAKVAGRRQIVNVGDKSSIEAGS
jgi:glucose-1-phosphate thymidylyltransferase